MEITIQHREKLLAAILEWARACPEILAMAVVGSGARVDTPADAWSDWDLVLAAKDPRPFLASVNWTQAFGQAWVSTVEKDGSGQVTEQRVLFRNGIDVDFLVISPDPQALKSEPLASILRRGVRVLFDSTGLFAFPPGLGASLEGSPALNASDFLEVVNDFWFHVVWAAKKTRRGEFWTAKSCVDGYMKQHLLRVVEWRYANQANTWYSGRFLERWAPPDLLEDLEGVFAHYAGPDIWQALQNTARLFDRVARETAERENIAYPAELAQEITDLLQCLRDGSKADRNSNYPE